MKERKDGPVITMAWKPTKQEGVVNVHFKQECLRPITSNSAMRKLFMHGHKSFGPITDIRNTWVIMTAKAYHEFGLAVGNPFPASWEPRIIACEFCDGDQIPEAIQDLYDGAKVFYHKSWAGGGQQPKTMPGSGEVLTHNGSPIYRDNHLVIGDVQKNDYLKVQDSRAVELR